MTWMFILEKNTTPNNTSGIGDSGNVVLTLYGTVPNDLNHLLHIDNCFTFLKLFEELETRLIHCLGTVRSNRLSGVSVTSDKQRKRDEVRSRILNLDTIALSNGLIIDRCLCLLISCLLNLLVHCGDGINRQRSTQIFGAQMLFLATTNLWDV
ncbi:Transposase IS4 [Popillia japonica]|uniref:Transposase IS4 n=1 Tax=Popillia japonica TaxID=7064 RepID=A0AAW1ITR6_POPJA